MTDLSTKRVLITGATDGLGRGVALAAARRHATVLVHGRHPARTEALAAELRAAGAAAVRVYLADFASLAEVRKLASAVIAGEPRLDVLVNNAGIARTGAPPSTIRLGTVREVFETNVFGVMAVTQALLPLLRAAPAGRIVNVTSELGSLGNLGDPAFAYRTIGSLAYGPSKTALNAVTMAFANELRDTPIKVNSACPGYTATDLNGHRGPRTVEQAARAPVRLATLPPDGPTGGFFNEDGPLPW
jgi:NAD(P)-dependent dehydrogenase (short-subunit alcohol dehydrogenase family)